MKPRTLQFIASTSLIALIFLCLAWELWLAPLRPGGSALVFKSFFLLLPLFGILRGKRYTYQWSSLFILFYVMEGLVRATSEHGLSQTLAMAESVLSIVFFGSVVFYCRLTRGQKVVKTAA